MQKRLALLAALLFPFSIQADWLNSLENGWKNTKEKTSSYYEKASEAIKDRYEATLEAVTPSDPLRESTNISKERTLAIWDDAWELFEEYSDLRAAHREAPVSAFFSTTKSDYDKKIDTIFQEITKLMDDPEIAGDRETLATLKEKIRAAELRVTTLKAKATLASGEVNNELLEEAGSSAREINEYQQARSDLINRVRIRLAGYGLSLSNGQVNVLLSRVDAGDILTMTTVFSVISEMTRQFSEAMASSSGENLAVAKKYYGFHVALLELQIHIQALYINQLQSVYITNVHRIMAENAELISKTTGLFENATGTHRNLYQRNLKAQTYTQEVANLYAEILTKDLKKVQQARKKVTENHQLAINTFETVSVSADLATQMSENRRLFNEIMALQAPELIPFENLQMQHEFEALSAQIADVES